MAQATTQQRVVDPAAAPDLRLVSQLISIARTTRRFLEIKLADIDVVPGQNQFLTLLRVEGQSSIVQLADRLSVRPSTTSKMASILARKGWVERLIGDEDLRLVLVRLTALGHAVAERVREIEARLDAEFLGAIDDERSTVAALAHLDQTLAGRLRRLR